jgi:hypothetical protein
MLLIINEFFSCSYFIYGLGYVLFELPPLVLEEIQDLFECGELARSMIGILRYITKTEPRLDNHAPPTHMTPRSIMHPICGCPSYTSYYRWWIAVRRSCQ